MLFLSLAVFGALLCLLGVLHIFGFWGSAFLACKNEKTSALFPRRKKAAGGILVMGGFDIAAAAFRLLCGFPPICSAAAAAIGAAAGLALILCKQRA